MKSKSQGWTSRSTLGSALLVAVMLIAFHYLRSSPAMSMASEEAGRTINPNALNDFLQTASQKPATVSANLDIVARKIQILTDNMQSRQIPLEKLAFAPAWKVEKANTSADAK